MSSKTIEEILNCRNIAVVGVSRNQKGFGFTAVQSLINSGCNVYAVNKNSIAGDGANLYPKLSAIPVKLDAIITTVPPTETINVLNDAIRLGINKVWLQPGSDSKEVKDFCETNHLQFVSGECIIMYLKNIGFIHRAHKWIHDKFEHRRTAIYK
jgi:predicted CoA-binding protein